jgi:predicted dehydrogenase
MLDDGKLDVVVIESPPYFHPEQARAAVDAGKHVYLAKPIAVDVPGCHSIEQSGMKAKENKQVFLIDFQTRNNESYRKAVQLVHEGRIGRLVSGQATYPCGVLRIQAPKTPEERLKYWYNNRAISGDFIVEQSIHTIDVATWITDAHPIRCVGAGGSKGLRSYGENWDHFNCVYWFPEEVVISFNSVQMVHGAPIEIPCRVYGAKGTIDTDYYSHACIWGPEPYEGGKFDNLYTSGTVNNIRDFHKYVTEGVCENETVVPSVRSNLSAIMAREAAYTGKTIQWDELIRDENRLVPDLKGLKA